eukprot:CAMPEP_0202383050 /NCGR_PEP_ID=MMETSP1127-20130417/46828_1 /ASSEMBLY_ACC=CAM_ASM_000462 /TAXON_ID=3047 /ORGANISM="Dunaliella tertiolecta, Strain CCMP1320" /LENGTH=57 /DNA_ID=CAMNT_0048982417 /DNA_START=269 /DNA_END=442 /DNA_ORIENTATION=-
MYFSMAAFLRFSCQARALTSKLKVFPQPVGASNSAFWPLFRAPMSLLMKASWTPYGW